MSTLTEMTFLLATLLPPVVVLAGAATLLAASLSSRGSHQQNQSVDRPAAAAVHQPVGH